MKIINATCRKFNQVRKIKWSAPTIMTAFIITCMLLIFGFESLGMINRHKVVIISANQKSIKAVFTNYALPTQILIKEESGKENKSGLDQMMKILIEGALDQIEYDRQCYPDEFDELYDF